MGLVVNRIQPAVNSAYHARAKTIGVSLKSVYNKLDNLETGISAAMVGTTAERVETVVTTMGGALPPLLPGYRIKIHDGNHLAATEHRIKELRTIRAGALPGQALVVLDPSLMLVTDVVLCEDGHAQERSLLGQILRDRPCQGRLDRRPQLLINTPIPTPLPRRRGRPPKNGALDYPAG